MYIGDHARSNPDAPAVVMWPSGAQLSWSELHARSSRLANLFRSEGLREGDHVAIYAYNHLRYYEAAFAAVNSGLYLTPVNAHSPLEEAEYIVNDCGAKVLIVADSTADVAQELVALTPQVRVRLSLDDSRGSYVGLDAAVSGQEAELSDSERRGTFMFYSSGTTGRPKGIKPPLPDIPAAAGDPIGLGFARFSGGPDPVYLSPAPLHHAAPLRTSMGVLEAGSTVVCMERFDPEGALAAIERHRVTSSQWVPTMFIRMLKLHPNVRARYDLSSLRVAVHAAAPCPAWAKEQMIEWWGPVIDEYYAGSENIGSTWITSEEWLAHRGSVGKSAQGEVHICDAEGGELATGEDGLVYFEVAPGSAFEYHDDPGKTAGVWHPTRPWRTLGDIGHVDTDQYLYLSDRATFMIISGGANVYPQEIESVLVAHPQVIDAAVFGVPDDDLGEVALAVVQPACGADPDTLLAELRELCRAKLARYKIPARFDLRDSLPRGEDGKLRKKPLRDEYWTGASRILEG
jgi:long-chain acyl-CoA synthetase